MSDEEARDAVAAYTDRPGRDEESPRGPKRSALEILKAWMRRKRDVKVAVEREDSQPRAAPPGTPSTTAGSTPFIDPETRAGDRDRERVGGTCG